MYKLIMKNGDTKMYKYFMSAVKAYWKEYGWDVKAIDTYLIKVK